MSTWWWSRGGCVCVLSKRLGRLVACSVEVRVTVLVQYLWAVFNASHALSECQARLRAQVRQPLLLCGVAAVNEGKHAVRSLRKEGMNEKVRV